MKSVIFVNTESRSSFRFYLNFKIISQKLVVFSLNELYMDNMSEIHLNISPSIEYSW